MKTIKLLITILTFSAILMACVKENQNEEVSNAPNVQLEPTDEVDIIDSNLELTREEKIRTIALKEEYFFQGKRGEENINSSRPLSEDSLLYLIEKEYTVKENWEEYLLPASDEITYKDIKGIANQLLQTYVKPSDEPEKIMVGYQNYKYKLKGSGAVQLEYVARWYAFCSFSEGDDYGVWIDANTGDLLNLTRYPMDWFDDKKDFGEFQILQEGNFSDEDILTVASDYLENLGLTVKNVEFASSASSEEILLNSLNYVEKVKIPTRMIYAYLSDGKSVSLNFLVDDLTIQAIYIR